MQKKYFIYEFLLAVEKVWNRSTLDKEKKQALYEMLG